MRVIAPGDARDRGQSAFTVAEIVVAVFLLALVTISLFAALSSGVSLVQMTRENLRATQILTQKMETIRLLTWLQSTNPALAPSGFTERYDPGSAADSSGLCYHGVVSVTPAPDSVPADYRNDMRLVTVTVYWTNSANQMVRSRQMQTYIARYGLQNYLYPR